MAPQRHGNNIDLSCGRTTEPDIVLGSILGLTDTLPQQQHGSWTLTGPQKAAQPTGMPLQGNKEQGSRHGPWQQPHPGITVVLGGKQTSYPHSLLLHAITTDPGSKGVSNICPLLSISSFMCLSTACGPFCFSLSPVSPPYSSLKWWGPHAWPPGCLPANPGLRTQTGFPLACWGLEVTHKDPG